MAGMRPETKAAEALAHAVQNRGFQAHAFLIRLQEFPSFIQREVMKIFLLWIRVMAADRNNEYSVWPDDLRVEAGMIQDRIADLYDYDQVIN